MTSFIRLEIVRVHGLVEGIGSVSSDSNVPSA